MWWNYEIKSAVKRKEAAWKKVLPASDEEAKERCFEVYKEEKRRFKKCIYQSKSLGSRKVWNEDVNGNRKLFWKEVSKSNEPKAENSSRIKNENGRLSLEEVEERRI